MRNYYHDLDLAHNASPQEIKAQFRRLAREHHPDKNGTDGSRFQHINEAYQVLNDADKRKEYDRTLQQTQSRRKAPHSPSPQFWSSMRTVAASFARTMVEGLEEEIEEEESESLAHTTAQITTRHNTNSVSVTVSISRSALQEITSEIMRGLTLDEYTEDVGMLVADATASAIMESWRG